MNTVDKIEQNLSALSSLLDEENVVNIKKRISNLIVARVASDINDYDSYLFYPPDYKGIIEESFEQIEKKIKKMYKDAMLESAEAAVNRFKDISIASLDDTLGLKLRSCHKCKHRDGNRCTFYEDKYYWKAHDSICAEEGFIQFVEADSKERR